MEKQNAKGKEISYFRFSDWPIKPNFNEWKHGFLRDVANGSGQAKKAYTWICAVEEAQDIHELYEKPGNAEATDFESLNSKIASGIYNLLAELCNFRKEVRVMEEKFKKLEPPRMLNGRQCFFLMIKHFSTNSAADALYDLETILAIELKGGNLEDFQNTWDMVMLKVPEANLPPKSQLELLYRKQIRCSYQFSNAFEQHNFQVMFKGAHCVYDTLQEMVRTYIEQRKIDRNINDMKDGGKLGLVAGKATVKKRSGECYSWLQHDACYDKSNCPWKHPMDRKGLGKGGRSSTPKGKGKGKEGKG